MIINLWLFLSIAAVLITILVISSTMIINKRKLKEIELEALKAKNSDLNTVIEKVVARHVKYQNDRIETLEAIVTDRKYQLNENLHNLR
ncbi:hypothetical protein [Paraglaciecola arctica]|uniref:hypothetical protein n=1 Tax=Paraglaciecola arctica TaxID=1128911 RepID=UPI001C07D815|nr:hypothetical protein [Paraglaciecola arctica]MBU3003761.1 hypothetical protein [Paraglaciecola arctica]